MDVDGSDRVPAVSIGLPVYNGARYLGEAVDSLLAQTFEDFELIISDNGSTDETEQICRGYAGDDPRVRYMRCETNRGLLWNFRYVLELARAPRFKWMAHDDVCAPEFLARCVEELDADPELVLCAPTTVDIDADGNRLRQFDWPARTDSPDVRERFHDILRDRYAHPFFGVIRTAAVRELDMSRPCLAFDKVVLAELALRGRLRVLDDPLLLHREHTNRSMRVHGHRAASRLASFDPARANRVPLPLLWQALASYQGLRRAPLPAVTRWRCAAMIPVWVASRPIRLAAEFVYAGLDAGDLLRHNLAPRLLQRT
jgi:glycosyltransferase involved in cell wall biosynthesis